MAAAHRHGRGRGATAGKATAPPRCLSPQAARDRGSATPCDSGPAEKPIKGTAPRGPDECRWARAAWWGAEGAKWAREVGASATRG